MIKISSDIRNFAILTLVTVTVWIGYEVYNIYNDATIPEEYQKISQPIELKLDTKFLKSLTVKNL